MTTYELFQRTTGYEKIQKNDLWLLSMFEARHHNGNVNVRASRVPRASMQDLYDRMGSMEIRQEAIKRIEDKDMFKSKDPQVLSEPGTSVKSVKHSTKAKNLRKDTPKSKACMEPCNEDKSSEFCKDDYPHSNRHVVPTAVLTRSMLVPLNASRPVTTDVPYLTVTSPRPAKHGVNKAHSTIRRPINHRQAPKHRNFYKTVTIVKGNPYQALKDKGVIHIGCSRHMTSNISYLSDIEEIIKGYVAFGGNPKGGKTQTKMCDKNNDVLFTDIECVVLSSDFKLSDENHVLLRVPRENNMVLVTKPHNKTPYELLLRRTPSIGFMRPFGYLVTILNTLDPLGKFDGKADEGFLVGYSINSKAFGVFNRKGPKWLFDIDILTQSMNYQPVLTGNQPNHNACNKENLDAYADVGFDVKENENEVYVSPSSSDKSKKHDQKTKREAKGKNLIDLSTRVRDLRDEFKEFSFNITDRVNAANAPVNAIGPNLTNNTNSFNATSPSNTAVSPTFEIDDEEDVGAEADFSNLETSINVSPIPTTRVHKDHHGHTLEEGIDYEEVFPLVARIEGIRLFLAYASFMGSMVYQMDVKSTFLYETIEEEVHVCQPPGFEDPDYLDKVYKMVKALYGLHQAPRAWYETLANYLLKNDQTLFIKKQKGDILLVQVFVDDIIFGSTNKELCKAFEKLMKNKKFGLTDGKSASTPIDTEKPLLKDPNVKRIFRYLKGKLHLGLWYPKDSPFNLVEYSDSDYAGSSLDRKSTTGCYQFLGCKLISWQCKKQNVVATSPTEAEYVVVTSCCA
nr:hypothetical protein [Tanacetum cinerariifolium]